jgi:hypothetical protein
MMVTSWSNAHQDTTRGRNNILIDPIGIKIDSVLNINNFQSKDTIKPFLSPTPAPPRYSFSDTNAKCRRNCVADITFYDSNNIFFKGESVALNKFPSLFIEKNQEMQKKSKEALVKQLKPGQYLPVQQLHNDWAIVIILIVAFLFSFITSKSKGMFLSISKFFLLRGINDPSSRDIGGMFHWQSTVLNLISFLAIGLFAFNAASFSNIIPFGIQGIILWSIIVIIIVMTITLRHIVCLLLGSISGEKEIFREYLFGVYQFYRFSSFFLFILVILMSYTAFFTVKTCLITGGIVLAIMYLIRVIRLIIIFLHKNISIFYLILYLCALEILPVVISVKYFTGLI